MEIPYYRAQEIDGEKWLEGFLSPHKHIVMGQVESVWYEITNPDKGYRGVINHYTLAIHFPTWIDKNGIKIFASLSQDGLGGDVVDMGYNYIREAMVMGKSMFTYDYTDSEVIEIKTN